MPQTTKITLCKVIESLNQTQFRSNRLKKSKKKKNIIFVNPAHKITSKLDHTKQ